MAQVSPAIPFLGAREGFFSDPMQFAQRPQRPGMQGVNLGSLGDLPIRNMPGGVQMNLANLLGSLFGQRGQTPGFGGDPSSFFGNLGQVAFNPFLQRGQFRDRLAAISDPSRVFNRPGGMANEFRRMLEFQANDTKQREVQQRGLAARTRADLDGGDLRGPIRPDFGNPNVRLTPRREVRVPTQGVPQNLQPSNFSPTFASAQQPPAFAGRLF